MLQQHFLACALLVYLCASRTTSHKLLMYSVTIAVIKNCNLSVCVCVCFFFLHLDDISIYILEYPTPMN